MAEKIAITQVQEIFKDPTHKHTKNNIWYDTECRIAKRNLRKHYGILTANAYRIEDQQNYLETKKTYNHILRIKKNNRNLEIRQKINNVRNATQFWDTWQKLQGRKYKVNPVPLASWEEFYVS